MQYPFSPLPRVLSAIEATMSPARLARYMGTTKGDKHHALRLYVWNARLCEEFYIPLQFSEVSLRNSIHRRLTELYGTAWFDQPRFTGIIPDRHKDEIAKVVADERQKRGRSFMPDHVVAGMSFGFWQNLLGSRLEFVLWRGGIQAAFPHLPNGFGRNEVYRRLERLRKFRNAVMHHYAIFDKGPTDEYRNIRTLLEWMCPDTLWLMSELSNPAAVLQRRPRL
ncbi:hypothetical protein [Bradyrhizobium vignae]|uniref:hypothetical protein n=1 Tax=Bradyrhizobium vignae TaxID=1549949 RepID=UPI00100B6DEC|nr:hypothetical protein [Bradyrhizobium vignae]RXH05961.1 hypothetical protein EAV90_05480 [Bradyrhizobium vignae]